ncbi:MAG: hypothetical protein HYV32_03530 [Candidatus Kerfeldbacteria bacterium]|nr:hypothetical protein [Candidatus Kerfeldbacteria bacterium]
MLRLVEMFKIEVDSTINFERAHFFHNQKAFLQCLPDVEKRFPLNDDRGKVEIFIYEVTAEEMTNDQLNEELFRNHWRMAGSRIGLSLMSDQQIRWRMREKYPTVFFTETWHDGNVPRRLAFCEGMHKFGTMLGIIPMAPISKGDKFLVVKV